jgi:hypothetical protein
MKEDMEAIIVIINTWQADDGSGLTDRMYLEAIEEVLAV